MLGKVIVEEDGVPLEFVLQTNGVWTCSNPDAGSLVTTLNILFNLRNSSPADGALGARQVNAAVDWFKGFVAFRNVRAVFPPREPLVPGRVY